jgi:hypothetical protein
MRSLRMLVAASLLVLTEYPAVALTFSDSFATNPYPTRWCERFHHVHWIGGHMRGFRASDGVCDAGGCCSGCVAGCSTAPTSGANLAITRSNFAGTVRSGAIDFGFPVALNPATGDHIAVFSVVHPNCHTGYEGILAPTTSGTFNLSAGRVSDSTRPECDDHPTVFSGAITGLTVNLAVWPRYRLELSTQPSGPLILAFARLTDNQTGQLLGVIGWYSDYPTSWYNTAARGFGFGSVTQVNTATNGVRFENFLGMY